MTNIFVARLDYGVTQEDLKNAFEQFGKVNKVSLATDKETGKSKGFAFIEMYDEIEANQAISALNDSTLKGRQIAVKKAEDRSDNRPKRDFKTQENKPFKAQERTASSSEKPFRNTNEDSEDIPEVFIPSLPPKNKLESKKKDLSARKHEDKPKNHKMPAYKKSGKQSKFFLDDDDDLY